MKIDGGDESTDDGPDDILGNADDISHGDFIDVSLSSGANIDAGDGDDFVAGSRFADLIFGGAGGDEIAGNGGADQIDGGTGQDKIVLTFAGLGEPRQRRRRCRLPRAVGHQRGETVDFEATSTTFTDDRLHDLAQVSHLYTFKVAPATSDPAIYVRDVENVVFFAGNGTDLMRVNDMRNSDVDVLELDLGGNDFAPDRVVVQGSSGNDDFKLNTDTPNVNTRTYDKIRTTAKISGSSSTTYSLIVGGTNRDHGDVLRFETGDGNDIVDASALGGEQTISTGVPAVQTTVRGSNLIALQIVTGNGDDRLIGSPWNDLLDGGRGSDRYTGGDGLDTFFDATIDHQSNQTANLITGQRVLLVGGAIGGTPGAIYQYLGANSTSPVNLAIENYSVTGRWMLVVETDVLVETFDRDMGLFDDTFTVGHVTSPTGGAFGLTPPITEADLKAEFLVDDPDLRFPYVGDYWTLSTIVEDLKFIFEQAELSRRRRPQRDRGRRLRRTDPSRRGDPQRPAVDRPGDARQRRQHREHVPRVLHRHRRRREQRPHQHPRLGRQRHAARAAARTMPTGSRSTPRATAPNRTGFITVGERDAGRHRPP